MRQRPDVPQVRRGVRVASPGARARGRARPASSGVGMGDSTQTCAPASARVPSGGPSRQSGPRPGPCGRRREAPAAPRGRWGPCLKSPELTAVGPGVSSEVCKHSFLFMNLLTDLTDRRMDRVMARPGALVDRPGATHATACGRRCTAMRGAGRRWGTPTSQPAATRAWRRSQRPVGASRGGSARDPMQSQLAPVKISGWWQRDRVKGYARTVPPARALCARSASGSRGGLPMALRKEIRSRVLVRRLHKESSLPEPSRRGVGNERVGVR